MERRDFNYPSKDGQTMIHALAWAPEGEVRAVVQIAHGMVEFVSRYDRFAKVLAAHGIYVVGNDHLGHGASVIDDGRHGYFAAENGNACVIGDMHTLRQMTAEQYPAVPYFFLGHSMGSFLVRQYITMYGEGLSGVILSGTGYQSAGTLRTARALCRAIARVRGWEYRSKLVNQMALGSYNKAFRPARTPNDWLTRDTKIVDAYCENPWNNFVFTLNAYDNLFAGLQWAEDRAHIAQIPKDLPVYLVAGGEDPVGERGKGPQQVAASYLAAGLTDVQVKIFPGDRHEILNELDRDAVDAALLDWLEAHMPKERA